MTIDVTTLSGVTRISSNATANSNAGERPRAPVVAINVDLSEQQQEAIREQPRRNIERAAQQINDFARQIGTNLEFAVDDTSGRVIITVREAETGNIVRQIPPEELLNIAELVRENATNNAFPAGILLADRG